MAQLTPSFTQLRKNMEALNIKAGQQVRVQVTDGQYWKIVRAPLVWSNQATLTVLTTELEYDYYESSALPKYQFANLLLPYEPAEADRLGLRVGAKQNKPFVIPHIR